MAPRAVRVSTIGPTDTRQTSTDPGVHTPAETAGPTETGLIETGRLHRDRRCTPPGAKSDAIVRAPSSASLARSAN